MAVLTNLRKAANHPLLLRNHYSDNIIAKMSIDILKVNDLHVHVYCLKLVPPPTCTCMYIYYLHVCIFETEDKAAGSLTGGGL